MTVMQTKTVYCYLILAAISFLVYFNAIGNQFVFDDESLIQNNESIRGVHYIPGYFTGEEGFHKVIGRYYRPVVSSTYAIDYSIWGLDPKGFHITNILIHTIATLILFSLLMHIFGRERRGVYASFLGTIIFAVHTIHTEAVTWVSGRTDSIVTLFFFAAFLFFIKYRQENENNNKYLYLTLLMYLFGLLSKEMIITFPVIIFLYDTILGKKSVKEILSKPEPYIWIIGLTFFYLVIRYLALMELPERESYLYFIGKDGMTVFATMIKTIPVYIKLLFIPTQLLYHYNGYIPDSNSIFETNVLITLLLILGLLIYAVIIKKQFPIVSFAILFFFVSLLPVMNIIPTMNLMAERFLYMPSLVVSLLAGWFYFKFESTKAKDAVAIIIIIVTVCYAYLTLERNKDWFDNDTLYATGEGIDANVLLVNAGNIYANRTEYDEAAARYRRAIEIREQSVLAHHNLGLIHLIRHELDSAEYRFKRGIEIDSLAPDGYYQLAGVYRMQGRIDEAEKMLNKLQSIAPDFKGSSELLRSIRAGQEPEVDYMKNQIVALKNRQSFQFYNEEKYREAIVLLQELVEINPDDKGGYFNNIAMCYEAMGNLDSAKVMFTEAINLGQDNINALAGLANIELQLGNKNVAIKLYEEILQKSPGDETATQKLDSLRK